MFINRRNIQVILFIMGTLLVTGCASTQAARAITQQNFYVITHMSNTTDSVDWSIRQGANAVEMDLNYNKTGEPKNFYHGGLCDCICSYGKESVCSRLKKAPDAWNRCEAEEHVDTMFAHLASKSELALIVLDNKVSDLTTESQINAGRRVVEYLNSKLMNHQFKGKVIVGVAKSGSADFLHAAIQAAKVLPIRSRIHFTFDELGKDANSAITEIQALNTQNVAFGTGISACLPKDFKDTIGVASAHPLFQPDKPVYIWTLDSAESMRQYLKKGVNGIMTNKPVKLLRILKENNIPLAK